MLEVEELVSRIGALSASAELAGRKVLIGSGPTEEPIDPVRVVTNRSSGKMGAALARAALGMGASVTVVSGPAAEPLPAGVRRIDVRTAAQMQKAMASEFARCDICVMAAAVSDFRPQRASRSKIARSGAEGLTVKLVPNPDILAALGRAKKRSQFLVGFALESEKGVASAATKLERKKCDMMVLNYVGSSLGLDTARVTIVYRDGKPEQIPAMDKAGVARRVFARIADLTGR
jgi:phosphopantothenoylcysteine decarboxylase/phosphopantothenate--cysteine ligase